MLGASIVARGSTVCGVSPRPRWGSAALQHTVTPRRPARPLARNPHPRRAGSDQMNYQTMADIFKGCVRRPWQGCD